MQLRCSESDECSNVYQVLVNGTHVHAVYERGTALLQACCRRVKLYAHGMRPVRFLSACVWFRDVTSFSDASGMVCVWVGPVSILTDQTHWSDLLLLRPVTSLDHQGWQRVFREGTKFFKLCPTHFSRGTKHFVVRIRPPPCAPPSYGPAFTWTQPIPDASENCASLRCVWTGFFGPGFVLLPKGSGVRFSLL